MIYYSQKAKNILNENLGGANIFSKGYFKENNGWIAFDNYSGDCFVEEFSEEGIAIAWLENHFEMSEIEEFKISKILKGLYYIKGKGILKVKLDNGQLTSKLFQIPNSFNIRLS
ncbi:MAG: hypothetical protein ABI091_28335, partial [Ferruginibacter sp.]